jgi:hypothetical protein
MVIIQEGATEQTTATTQKPEVYCDRGYGLPTIRKPDVPLRPISSNGSPLVGKTET